MKNVIHIYGASGSGTSTLGRKICDELGYRFMDTDDYFWLPTNPQYTTKRNKEERIMLMRKDIEEADNVVISGSLVDWGDELISLFTLVIRLETDTKLRIARLRHREKQKFGERIELGGDMFENHKEFIEWASAYDTGSVEMRSKAKHDEWQKLLKCKQIELNGADELEYNFNIIRNELNNIIGKIVTVTVDRPLGSYHPTQKDFYYPINYGYIEGIMAADGEEQDAYIIGVDISINKFTGKVIAVVHRKDDLEDKWVVCPENMQFSLEEIQEKTNFQEQYFDSQIII